MLDLALLSANAAQLKFILSNWEQQEFNTFLLWLVATSIVLQVKLNEYYWIIWISLQKVYRLINFQVAQAVVCVVLGLIFDINQIDDQKKAEIINNVSLAISIVVVAINVLISVFDVISSKGNLKDLIW